MTKKLEPIPQKVPAELLLRHSTPAQSWQLANPNPMLCLTSMSPYRPTRKEFLIGAGSLLVLAPFGCGTGEQGDGASGGTRTVEHAMGETEVPAEPGRIVALSGQMDLDALLALGLQPVAAGANFENDTAVNPWSQDRMEEDVEVFKFRPEPDPERIATFEPDLIIGHEGWLEPVYEELSQLAPTVVTEYDGGVEGDGRDVARPVPHRSEGRRPGGTRRGDTGRNRRGDSRDCPREAFRARGPEGLRCSRLGEGWQAYLHTGDSHIQGTCMEQARTLGRPAAQT